MNDINLEMMEAHIANRINPDEHRRLRSIRRAMAINAVAMAREHAGNGEEPYSQNDADVIMAIMELLDRVAGT